ncbi:MULTISPECIES: hypothetical protein [Streptomyces]|uniref:hypothetical protein n=1 Tax=Streptomyces TaxID=1883 RepID=UPI00089B7134|nr:hypothetical protein [Streptomyces sp. KS_5]SEE83585.1 hypothetical protein SAMN05428938_8974 [Streptomyces sp. KS_5]
MNVPASGDRSTTTRRSWSWPGVPERLEAVPDAAPAPDLGDHPPAHAPGDGLTTLAGLVREILTRPLCRTPGTQRTGRREHIDPTEGHRP